VAHGAASNDCQGPDSRHDRLRLGAVGQFSANTICASGESAPYTNAAAALLTRHKTGDIEALKGMFGKPARTVAIEEMNPRHRKP